MQKTSIYNASSRCILTPFEWYGRPKKALKKVLVKLFPYIFHEKTEWNIVYKYLKTKAFSRDTNILSQIHWTWNNFGNSLTTIGRNYPVFSFKKTVCQKNVWMQHWYKGLSKNSCSVDLTDIRNTLKEQICSKITAISVVQVFSLELISHVVSFSRIFSIH